MVERTSQRKRQAGEWGIREEAVCHMVHTNEQDSSDMSS